MFTNPNQNLGTIHLGQKLSIDFYYTDEVAQIIEVQGCGCTSIDNDHSKSRISMVYMPSRIPKHYEAQGHWTTTKTYNITVKLASGEDTATQISFTVTVAK